MADTSDYGVILSKSGCAVAGVKKIDFPELSNDALENTSHGSGGKKEYISSGLVGLSEFKVTLGYVPDVSGSLVTDLVAGTSGSYAVTFPNNEVWSFYALCTKFKPLGGDASKPEVLNAEVSFQPTGEMTV